MTCCFCSCRLSRIEITFFQSYYWNMLLVFMCLGIVEGLLVKLDDLDGSDFPRRRILYSKRTPKGFSLKRLYVYQTMKYDPYSSWVTSSTCSRKKLNKFFNFNKKILEDLVYTYLEFSDFLSPHFWILSSSYMMPSFLYSFPGNLLCLIELFSQRFLYVQVTISRSKSCNLFSLTKFFFPKCSWLNTDRLSYFPL